MSPLIFRYRSGQSRPPTTPSRRQSSSQKQTSTSTWGQQMECSAQLKLCCLRLEQANCSPLLLKNGCPLTCQSFSNILKTLFPAWFWQCPVQHPYLPYRGSYYCQTCKYTIQMLDRWKSNAYQAYINAPRKEFTCLLVYLTTCYQKNTELTWLVNECINCITSVVPVCSCNSLCAIWWCTGWLPLL